MNNEWTGRTIGWDRPPIAAVAALGSQLRAQGVDVIDLGQAIVGLDPPPLAIKGVKKHLDLPGPHPYSPDPGLPELREAIAQMLVTHKNVPQATAENVMITCGANQAFANVLFCITQPNDEVITFSPGYFDHGYTIRMAGCTEVVVPLKVRQNRYTFELDDVLERMTDATRVVVLVSPGNPTGAVATRHFVKDLCAACKRRGVWLISDETYDMLTFEPATHHSPAALCDYERIAVLGTFSKTFAMAGWRIGYYFGSQPLMQESFKVQDALVVCAPVPSQHAAIAALKHMDSYLQLVRSELRKRRDALVDELKTWDTLQARIPDGATFLLAAMKDGGDDVALCKHILRRAGVACVPGSAFGQQGRGTIRLSFGNQPVDRIKLAGQRLRNQL